jgi:hypothetical protein
MYETIKRLYDKYGNKAIVYNAVTKGYITQEQADNILGVIIDG